MIEFLIIRVSTYIAWRVDDSCVPTMLEGRANRRSTNREGQV